MPRKPVLFTSAALTAEEAGIIREARQATGRRQFRHRNCFANSQLLAISDGRVGYAEGVAFTGRLVVHHGWNVIGGKVVDVTWKHEGVFPPPTRYLGLVFSAHEAREHWVSRGTGLVHIAMLEDVLDLYRKLESEVRRAS